MMSDTRAGRRPGLTLTEALVALFVAALGLVSLFTLFPLGALQLGQALRDDRCAQTALQADAYLRAYWERVWVEGSGEPAITTAFTATPPNSTFPPLTTGRGNPVFVDPLVVYAGTAASKNTVAGDNTTPQGQVSRQTIASLTASPDLLNTCTLLEDISFAPNGQPDGAPTAVTRQGKYNWAAVVQPTDVTKLSGPTAAPGDLKILVFDGRPPLFAPMGTEVVATNSPMVSRPTTAGGVDGSRSFDIQLPVAPDPNAPAATGPAMVRKGGWVMDGTVTATMRNANFYRIVGVTPTTPGLYTVDIDPPIRTPSDGSVGGTYPASIYLFAGLAEVFDRPQLRSQSGGLATNGTLP